mmetsp:Transcript_1959/g.4605  ORF Transcript_1959/g.4605 Transcript_1959/m.4605 type:complete len:251 (-) Transcript_1959:82-834(-)
MAQSSLSPHCNLQVVTLSEEKRRLVEEALGALGPSAGQGRPLPEQGSRGDVEEAARAANRLVQKGFAYADARAAVRELGPGSEDAAYLDWLCLNVEEQRLPARFRHTAEAKPIGVRFAASRKDLMGEDNAAESPAFALPDDFVERSHYGYEAEEAQSAFERTGDEATALRELFEGLAASEGIELSVEDGTCGSDLSEWEEERTALSAIFEDSVQFPSHDCARSDRSARRGPHAGNLPPLKHLLARGRESC